MADDFLDQLGDEKPRRKRSGKPEFNRPSVDRRTVRGATAKESSDAGDYKRKTLLLYPGVIDYVAKLARKEGLGLMAFWRWLIDQGLQNYEDGARPIPEEEPQTVVHDVKLDHWTARE